MSSFQTLDVGGNISREPSLKSFSAPHCNYRLVSRHVHKLNAARINRSTFSFGTWYHSLLEYSWWKLVILLMVIFVLFNSTFGLLFYWDAKGINGIPPGVSAFGAYYICFCFSVQTLTTIGYGSLSPNTYYTHTVAAVEGFLSFVASALLTGIVFAKISRPTKLSRQIIFSNMAVVNRVTNQYTYNSKTLLGSYITAQYPTISIRVVNARKSQLCSTQVRLLLLRREIDGVPTATTDYRSRAADIIHELDFEIYNQLGRNRGVSFSIPYLALPWTINHTINEESPLFRIPASEWHRPENHFELIVVLDAIDEGVSMNVQARWSYLPHEIVQDAKYVEVTKFNTNTLMYEIDFGRFNDVIPAYPNQQSINET